MKLYDTSMSLLTDLYQLTSAYAIWKAGKHNVRTCYHMFFRSNPFNGGYAVCAGLQPFLQWVKDFRFDQSDIDYLQTLKGNDSKPLFKDQEFFDFLLDFRFKCDIWAIPEGTIVFPQEPLVCVIGTMIENLFLETAMLCYINSQTLLATKASRVKHAAGNCPVLEFGLRRAQGPDGALSASRAAYIGGADATSNVLAGKLFGIPVKGTHPHGFVMFFESEDAAFSEYANYLPNNCVFLVDTYSTVDGVKNAIVSSLELKKNGYEPIGIRLDSGDLADLAKKSRKLLDDAGLFSMKVFASNDIDEYTIQSLEKQGAPIDVYGVGTKMVTAYDQPALGGVYKMSAIEENGKWVHKMKFSESSSKTTNPGILNVYRYYDKNNKAMFDVIFDELETGEHLPKTMVLPNCTIDLDNCIWQSLMNKEMEKGKLHKFNTVSRSLQDIRLNFSISKSEFDPGIFDFSDPAEYLSLIHI